MYSFKCKGKNPYIKKILGEKMKKSFYKAMMAIGIPIALQNLISASLNMVDTMMITRVSEEAVAAVGLANQLFFLLVLVTFGITSGTGVFVAQFFGKGDHANIRRTVGATLMVAVSFAAVFTLAAELFPKGIMRLLIDDENVIALGSDYLVIVALSYIATAITFSFMVASRSVGKAKLPMIVSAFALSFNTFFNYVLIFGKLGFPRLEVKGAAIATLIARVLELVILLYFVYRKENFIAPKLNDIKSISIDFIKRLSKVSLPVVGNEAFWALGTIMYSVALAKIGAQAVAAYQIGMNIFRFFDIAFIGMASAAQVMIGNEIGAGKLDVAKDYSKRYLMLFVYLTAALGLITFLLKGQVVSLFGLSAETALETEKIIIVTLIYILFKHVNLLYIVGVSRGGGDTTYAMKVEVLNMWLVGVPLAFFGALVLKWPAYMVVALFSFEEVLKAAFGFFRMRSEKWINNVVEDIN